MSKKYPRYLTKSRFKLATECPTKLYYTGKDEYADQKLEDDFLKALANGGFQVGELAKYYFPGGQEVKTLVHDDAVKETNELLQQANVIIFEAAIRFENLFIRVDVLVKRGNNLELVEVKAKSINSDNAIPFQNKDGTISAKWKPYLYDVAFQKYVLLKAFPGYSISSYLMLADRAAECPTDGLNQKFVIVKDENGRKGVKVARGISEEDLSVQILCQVNVDSYVDRIFAGAESKERQTISFEERVSSWADQYVQDEKITPVASSTCGKCEFYTTTEDDLKGLKSGFRKCWCEVFSLPMDNFPTYTVLDIWSLPAKSKEQCISQGRIAIDAINESDIDPGPDNKPGISPKKRRWLQVKKAQENDQTCWIDREILGKEMGEWIFPLHFIDFETSRVAIPFNKGKHSYEGIAFQFSHHVVNEDLSVEHKGQYLNTERGWFPNYDFVRALKSELDQDAGTIFSYSHHENSFLNEIYRQLQSETSPVSDRDILCEFIQSITKSTGSSEDQWEGGRNMVDLWVLVKRYYYDPATKGSNSMKEILPAILNSSKFLQKKYSKPIYGGSDGIPSLNYKDWQWIKKENGKIIDPYKLLPKMFQDISDKNFALLMTEEDELRAGGAAMTAYARLQFGEMSDYEREELQIALLKYCELDTLAMVMLYEGWREML